MPDYGPVTSCQTCGHTKLESVIFLGLLPSVNVMLPLSQTHDREDWFPAEMLRCPTCTLVQLGYVADPKLIFPPEYPYTSGTTRILRENFADLYQSVRSLMDLGPKHFVVDIGSNDGTLLKNFKDGGHKVLGVEPSLAAKLAEDAGIPTLMTFFGTEATDTVLREHGKADVITAANVFAHILEPNSVVENAIATAINVSNSAVSGGTTGKIAIPRTKGSAQTASPKRKIRTNLRMGTCLSVRRSIVRPGALRQRA